LSSYRYYKTIVKHKFYGIHIPNPFHRFYKVDQKGQIRLKQTNGEWGMSVYKDLRSLKKMFKVQKLTKEEAFLELL